MRRTSAGIATGRRGAIGLPTSENCVMTLNRREMLLAAGAALLGPGVAGRALAQSKKESKKVLFFTKSSGLPALGHRPQGRPAQPWPSAS